MSGASYPLEYIIGFGILVYRACRLWRMQFLTPIRGSSEPHSCTDRSAKMCMLVDPASYPLEFVIGSPSWSTAHVAYGACVGGLPPFPTTARMGEDGLGAGWEIAC